MIGIAIVTGALGVVQTLLSNQVGQRVMHDLRTSVYKHLQRLSLAFFTRTRTGEVQSRLANDIGGVQQVVTSTATSIVSNVTTVLATVVAMFVLDWRLTLFALALLPLFVWLTRRVGDQRRKVAKVRQESMADISSLVQESLSVSGILLGKTMGRADALATRFENESARLADLEVRSRMTGRWMMASIQTSFAVMPALVYLFAGHYAGAVSIGTVIAFTTLQARLFFPVGSLLGVSLDVQTSLALFDRVFEYLDQPVDIEEGTRTLASPSGHVAFDRVWFRYDDAAWTLQDVSFEVPAGSKTALVGETGSGKTTAGYLVARLYDATEGSVTIDGVDVRDAHLRLAGRRRRGRLAGDVPLSRDRAREPPLRAPGGDRRGGRGGGAGGADPRVDRDAARGLRDGRRRAGLPLLGRRAAADRDRADDPAQPADPRPRRGDLGARHADRAGRAGGARAARRGADDDRDRAPALDRSRRRPDRRARPAAASPRSARTRS